MHDLTKVTNLRTGAVRLYVDGKRVSQSAFDEYRAIGCFFSENNGRVRRFHAAGRHKWRQ